MSKLTESEIVEIAKSKHLTVLNPEEYINLTSDNLKFKCENGHEFNATLKLIRDFSNFKCPICEKQPVEYRTKPPKKQDGVFRIIGFDQATNNFGISVYDEDKLVYFDVFHFEGETEERLVQIANAITFICREWQPNYVMFEDIQLQTNGIGGYNTFKVLAELMGVVKVILTANKVPHTCVLNKIWQSEFNIGGKDRATQKANVIEKVYKIFDIKVSDDVADAILIGKYAVERRLRNKRIEKLF